MRQVPRAEKELPRADLVRKARQGDADAWGWIASEIRSRVVGPMRLPPQIDSEEVVADTLMSVWERLETLRDEEKLFAFAATIARRVTLRLRRDRARYRPLTREPCTASDPELGARNLDADNLFRSMSSSLREAEHKLFRLLYVVGASPKEVQSSLGISAPRLRKRKHRLHQRLRRVARV